MQWLNSVRMGQNVILSLLVSVPPLQIGIPVAQEALLHHGSKQILTTKITFAFDR